MTAQRLYSALLGLYPRDFRRDYGDQMTQAFAELHRARARSRVAFWMFVAGDTCRSALQARVAAWRPFVRYTSGVRWAGACATAAIVSGLAGNALTYAFSYFYHPYFEGLPVAPWMFGAIVGAGLTLTQVVVLRRWLSLGPAWVLVTALGSLTVLLCVGPTSVMLRGWDPISAQPPAIHAPVQPSSGGRDLAVELFVMAICGLVIAALTARPHASLMFRRRR